MNKILYLTSEIGTNIFASSSKVYQILNKHSRVAQGQILEAGEKNKFCKKIEHIIDLLILERSDSQDSHVYLTNYTRIYKNYNLTLNRSAFDIELLTWIDLLNFIDKSTNIRVYKLPSFDHKIVSLLSKMKDSDILISEISPDTLQILNALRLIDITGNVASLKEEIKIIPFFM